MSRAHSRPCISRKIQRDIPHVKHMVLLVPAYQTTEWHLADNLMGQPPQGSICKAVVYLPLGHLQGCGPEDTRCSCLSKLAKLYEGSIPHQQQPSTGNLSARGSTSSLSVAGSTAGGPAAADNWMTPQAQLLDWSLEHLSELTSDKIKLFPSDLNPVLEKYKYVPMMLQVLCLQLQGVRLPRLCPCFIGTSVSYALPA